MNYRPRWFYQREREKSHTSTVRQLKNMIIQVIYSIYLKCVEATTWKSPQIKPPKHHRVSQYLPILMTLQHTLYHLCIFIFLQVLMPWWIYSRMEGCSNWEVSGLYKLCRKMRQTQSKHHSWPIISHHTYLTLHMYIKYLFLSFYTPSLFA